MLRKAKQKNHVNNFKILTLLTFICHHISKLSGGIGLLRNPHNIQVSRL